MSALEKTIVKAILRYLNALPGCRAVKQHGSAYSRAGAPDVSCVYRGQAYFFEVKRPGGEGPTPIQIEEMARWTRAGAICACVRSVAEVKAILSSP